MHTLGPLSACRTTDRISAFAAPPRVILNAVDFSSRSDLIAITVSAKRTDLKAPRRRAFHTR